MLSNSCLHMFSTPDRSCRAERVGVVLTAKPHQLGNRTPGRTRTLLQIGTRTGDM